MLEQKLTAKDIIARFYRRVYFDGHVIFHETDYLYKPDIATISRDLFINEYEIKVSLQDLRKELDYIEFAIADHEKGIASHFDNGVLDLRLDESYEDRIKRREAYDATNTTKYNRRDNKYLKHRHYLFNDKGRSYYGNRPNKFFFLIPKHLYEAEKERIDRIPKYGVIEAQSFYSLKKCSRLHTEVAKPQLIWQAALNITGRVRLDLMIEDSND